MAKDEQLDLSNDLARSVITAIQQHGIVVRPVFKRGKAVDKSNPFPLHFQISLTVYPNITDLPGQTPGLHSQAKLWPSPGQDYETRTVAA